MDAQTNTQTRTPPRKTIRLRPEAFTDEELARYGWRSPTAAAKAVGVDGSTLRRAIAGQIAPGERLIAALLTGTRRPFDQLFRITEH